MYWVSGAAGSIGNGNKVSLVGNVGGDFAKKLAKLIDELEISELD